MWTAIVFGKVKAAGYASVALWMIPAAIRRGDAMLWGEARRRMVRPDYHRAGNRLGRVIVLQRRMSAFGKADIPARSTMSAFDPKRTLGTALCLSEVISLRHLGNRVSIIAQ